MRPDLPALGYRLHSAALRYRRDAREGWPRSGSGGAHDSMVLATPAAKAKMTRATPGPWSRHWRMARLETVLFLAREPLSSRKLSHLANLADGTEARTLIRGLNRFFDQSGTAFRVEEVAGGFQLFSRPQFSDWLRRLHGTTYEIRLSAPAMETLAVVAYRQPVVRAQIESIRGVQCGEILRQLMERDLVRIAQRSDELGRPFLYGTTKRFLQIFGLRHLEDLPRAELSRLLNKLPGLDEPEREEIRKSFDRLINKLLHPPLESLRNEARHGTPHALLEALKRLFHLKD